jgi:hypothetical protein
MTSLQSSIGGVDFRGDGAIARNLLDFTLTASLIARTQMARSMLDRYAGNKNIRRGFVLACLVWLLQPVASAQSDAEISAAVSDCQRVPELSSRLACYDRAFPPIVEPSNNEVLPARPQERTAPVAARAAPVEEPEPLPTVVEIVELEVLRLGTTRFYSADGRVFTRTSRSTIPQWPDTPFHVEVQVGRFGSTFLKFPDGDLRIRVAVED